MKKLISLLLVLAMAFSLAACGGDKEPSIKDNVPTAAPTEAPKETEAPTEPGPALTLHENTFFNVSYNEEDGWSLAEDDINKYESSGSAYIRILNEDGKTEIVVSIYADKKDPESFRKNLYLNGVDMQAYVAGEIETVDIGGQPML